MKKRIIRMAALALSAVLLLGVLGCSANPAGDTGYEGAFDYEKSDLTQYLNLPAGVYTGVAFDDSSYIYDEVSRDNFIETVDTLYKNLRFQHRTGEGDFTKSKPVSEGDDVYLYILGATHEGKAVAEALFSNAYGTYRVVTVGNSDIDEGLEYGDDFDQELIGMIPKNTALVKDTMNDPTLEDVVALTYTFAPKGGSKSENGSYERVALSDLEPAIAKALVENFKAFGESYSFEAKVTEEGEETETVYSCTATVHFVAKEQTATITYKVPEAFFAEKDNKTYGETVTDLNGKEITLEVIIPGFQDYTLPALDVAFFKDILEFETTETDVEKLKLDFLAEYAKRTNEEAAVSVKEALRSAIWQTMLSSVAQSGVYFTEAASSLQYETVWFDSYEEAYSEMYNLWYNGYRNQYADVNEFVYYYTYQQYGQQNAYQSLYAYAAESATSRVETYLVVYTIFRQERMSVSEEELEKAYGEYIENAIENLKAAAVDDSKTIDKAYVEELYGKDEILSIVRRDLISEKVMNFVVENAALASATKK